MEVGELVKSLASVLSPEQVGELQFLLDLAEEEADVLLLEGGDVVGPVDDAIKNFSLGHQPDHPAELRPVLQVVVQLVLSSDVA